MAQPPRGRGPTWLDPALKESDPKAGELPEGFVVVGTYDLEGGACVLTGLYFRKTPPPARGKGWWGTRMKEGTQASVGTEDGGLDPDGDRKETGSYQGTNVVGRAPRGAAAPLASGPDICLSEHSPSRADDSMGLLDPRISSRSQAP